MMTKEAIEDVKRLKEVLGKAKEREGKCENGEHCQKIIGEAELEAWLTRVGKRRSVTERKIIIEY